MDSEKSQWRGHLAALAVYIIFGINPNCSKAVVPEYIAPEVYTAVRMLFGCAGFWLLALFSKKEKMSWSDHKVLMGGGVIMAGTLLAFGRAFCYTSPAILSAPPFFAANTSPIPTASPCDSRFSVHRSSAWAKV